MEILFYILAVLAGAAVALGIYIPVRRYMLNGQKEDIIRKAEIEAVRRALFRQNKTPAQEGRGFCIKPA